MFNRICILYGLIVDICCIAKVPVEWLYGRSFSDSEVDADYYLTPVRREKRFTVVREGGPIGSFKTWHQFTTDYETKPTTPVQKALVFAVERVTLVQQVFDVAVNSKSGEKTCFSEYPEATSTLPEGFLSDLNRICHSKSLHVVTPSESLKPGSYSGEIYNGPTLKASIGQDGSLKSAQLISKPSQSNLLYMPLGGVFIHAKAGKSQFILKDPRGDDVHTTGSIGRSNLHTWDSVYKPKFRRRQPASLNPSKAESGNEADVEDNI